MHAHNMSRDFSMLYRELARTTEQYVFICNTCYAPIDIVLGTSDHEALAFQLDISHPYVLKSV